MASFKCDMSVLADGEIRLTPAEGGPVQRYEVKGGYVQVTDDKVIILADSATPVAA